MHKSALHGFPFFLIYSKDYYAFLEEDEAQAKGPLTGA